MQSAEKLIEELYHNVTVSGNKLAERRTADLTVWFYKNMDRIPFENPVKKTEFLQKAMWLLLENQALLLSRIHDLEARGKPKSLWTVNGLTVEGDLRRFG